MFDGTDSPLTQTFGLGMEQVVTAAQIERLEEFFQDLNAPVFHECSPLADPSAVAQLNERSYEPFEFTSVMFRPIVRRPRGGQSGPGPGSPCGCRGERALGRDFSPGLERIAGDFRLHAELLAGERHENLWSLIPR